MGDEVDEDPVDVAADEVEAGLAAELEPSIVEVGAGEEAADEPSEDGAVETDEGLSALVSVRILRQRLVSGLRSQPSWHFL